MDLNYLYHRRGQSLFMADRAASQPARNAHLGLARGYAARIEQARRVNVEAAAASNSR